MDKTFAQRFIVRRVKDKEQRLFQDNWADYIDYGDYDDCHGDYFDAE